MACITYAWVLSPTLANWNSKLYFSCCVQSHMTIFLFMVFSTTWPLSCWCSVPLDHYPVDVQYHLTIILLTVFSTTGGAMWAAPARGATTCSALYESWAHTAPNWPKGGTNARLSQLHCQELSFVASLVRLVQIVYHFLLENQFFLLRTPSGSSVIGVGGMLVRIFPLLRWVAPQE